MSDVPKLVPPPPADPCNMPVDADHERAKRYLRKLLAEGSLHPARKNLVQAELRKIERRAA